MQRSFSRPHNVGLFCIAWGAVYLFGGSPSEACNLAWSATSIAGIVAHSMLHWPAWRTNDTAAIPVLVGGALLVIFVKGLELIDLIR